MIKLYLDHARLYPFKVNLKESFSTDEITDSKLSLKEPLKEIYRSLDMDEDCSFALHGSSEELASNLLLTTYLEHTRKNGKNHFLFAAQSESPILKMAKRLNEMGALFEIIPLDVAGTISIDAVIDRITPRTAFISVPWACGFTGLIQPLEELSALCKERGILLHVDATHFIGKNACTIADSGADFFSFRLETFSNLTGAALFLSKNLTFKPACYPPLNFTHLQAFSLALSKAVKETYSVCTEVAYQKLTFEERLKEKLGDVEVFFHKKRRLPHITALHFPHVTADALAFLLYKKGLIASRAIDIFEHFNSAHASDNPKTHSILSFAFATGLEMSLIDWSVEEIAKAYKTLKKGAFL